MSSCLYYEKEFRDKYNRFMQQESLFDKIVHAQMGVQVTSGDALKGLRFGVLWAFWIGVSIRHDVHR